MMSMSNIKQKMNRALMYVEATSHAMAARFAEFNYWLWSEQMPPDMAKQVEEAKSVEKQLNTIKERQETN